MSVITEALLKNLAQLDMPIIILPETTLKKKKLDDALEEDLGTRLSEPSSTATTVIPSPSPG